MTHQGMTGQRFRRRRIESQILSQLQVGPKTVFQLGFERGVIGKKVISKESKIQIE